MDLKHEVVNDTIDETMGDDKLAFVNSWFLMGSPVPIALIVVSYLLFVTKLGPELMKNRKPFQLKNIILVYNIIQVGISYGLFHMCVNIISKHGLLPKTCVMETDAQRLMLTSAVYVYFLAKISELLDTVFFVLRKKDNQVTFLHVYHHALMATVGWISLKYEPRYVTVFLGIFNSFVHMIMYTYYGLSSFPSLAKYLWWKKYITSLQLIQFVTILVHYGIYHAVSECIPSKYMSFIMAFNLPLFIYMFGKFYVNTYNKTNKADPKATFGKKGKDTRASNDAKSIPNEVGKKKEEYTFETAYLNGSKAMNRKYNSIGNR